ncbi:major facilitator superfamily domain-containing protein [Lophiotrema nucula]|uniref:Major facilitator superfamily domain-containing protein n=1 Tax=Lophiotrema nucula TaxID=690887 RepID=A0A6A5ZNJ9_9PLEO|nr:major facilitator superfamily domain-containing protein [Lophiotrema nucula]
MDKSTTADTQQLENLRDQNGDDVKTSSSTHDPKAHRRLRHKIDRRLMPLCAWIYMLNYLDRSNIGNAKILNSETGDSFLQRLNMTAREYSIAITLFAIAYSAFDVPSNWVLKRYARPSYWLATLMLGWGILTLAFAFVKNYSAVLGVRFMIGLFEAGFYPGIVYLITFWYRQEERSLRIAFVTTSATLAGAFGGCIAYGVAFLNQKAGLEGWQWLFVIEGAVTIAATLLVVIFLPDYPSSAKWLSEEEREFAVQRIEEQQGGFTREPASRREILETCFSPRMLAHYVSYYANVVVISSLIYFCPTIVNGLGYSSVQAQLMTIPPWAIGFVISLCLAWSADHFNARGLHAAVAAAIAGFGFLACSLLPAHAYSQRYGCLIVACCGVFPSCSPLVAWVTCNVPSSRTVGLAAALNNATVGLASITAVWIWKADEASRGYPTGNIVCTVCSFVTAIGALSLRYHYGRMNTEGRMDVTGTVRTWAL